MLVCTHKRRRSCNNQQPKKVNHDTTHHTPPMRSIPRHWRYGGPRHAEHGPSCSTISRSGRQTVHERESKQRGKPRRQGPPRHPTRHIHCGKRGRQHDRRLRSDHEHGIGARHHRGGQNSRSHRREPHRQRQKRSDGVGGEESDRLTQRSVERKATQLLQ